MLFQDTAVFFLASAVTLFLSVSAHLPSWNQRQPGYWLRPGQQHRPSYGHDNPYEPDYPLRPSYPLRPDYPHQPGYPDSYPGGHDMYPERDCRYGRCDDRLEDYNPSEDGVHDLGDYDDYGDEARQSRQYGCSCSLNVGYTVVFRRGNSRERYSCDRYGLERCSRFCDVLFQDERFRANARQDACDALGRDIYTRWFRRDQVCGTRGPHRDGAMQMDLCCVKGRPSLDCEDDEIV